MITEHSLVVFDCDPDHKKLNRGDVGTVVHVYKNGAAYEVEFVDGGGATVALITFDAGDVRRIMPGELLHARRTVAAATDGLRPHSPDAPLPRPRLPAHRCPRSCRQGDPGLTNMTSACYGSRTRSCWLASTFDSTNGSALAGSGN